MCAYRITKIVFLIAFQSGANAAFGQQSQKASLEKILEKKLEVRQNVEVSKALETGYAIQQLEKELDDKFVQKLKLPDTKYKVFVPTTLTELDEFEHRLYAHAPGGSMALMSVVFGPVIVMATIEEAQQRFWDHAKHTPSVLLGASLSAAGVYVSARSSMVLGKKIQIEKEKKEPRPKEIDLEAETAPLSEDEKLIILKQLNISELESCVQTLARFLELDKEETREMLGSFLKQALAAYGEVYEAAQKSESSAEEKWKLFKDNVDIFKLARIYGLERKQKSDEYFQRVKYLEDISVGTAAIAKLMREDASAKRSLIRVKREALISYQRGIVEAKSSMTEQQQKKADTILADLKEYLETLDLVEQAQGK